MPKRGRPSFRSAAHQSCVAKRASRHLSRPLRPRVSPAVRGKCATQSNYGYDVAEGRRGREECRAKGRETCVEPTYTFSCPPQEVGYSASEARKADPRKAANSERRPQSSSRLPCPRSGDACRAGKRKLAVCNTLCAASDPSPGSTSSRKAEAMEREGAEVPVPGPRLEARTCLYGTEDPSCRAFHKKARQQPRKNHRVGADIQTRLSSSPFGTKGDASKRSEIAGVCPGRRCGRVSPAPRGKCPKDKGGAIPRGRPGRRRALSPFAQRKGTRSPRDRHKNAGVCPGRTRPTRSHSTPSQLEIDTSVRQIQACLRLGLPRSLCLGATCDSRQRKHFDTRPHRCG